MFSLCTYNDQVRRSKAHKLSEDEPRIASAETLEPDSKSSGTSGSGVIIGPNGIRAGWGLLIFLALLIAFSIPVYLVLDRIAPDLSSPILYPKFQIANEFLSFSAVALVTAIMATIEKRSILDYGFRDRRSLIRFVSGFGIGLVSRTFVILILASCGIVSYHGIHVDGLLATKFGAVWLVHYLFVALFEETLFRGYPQFTLARGWNFWTAAILFSLIFGAGHLDRGSLTFLQFADLAGAGLLFALSLRLTGSLFWAIGAHTAWNWTNSFVYGLPDRGTQVQGHFLTINWNPNGNIFGLGIQVAAPAIDLLTHVLVAIGMLWIWRDITKLEPTAVKASSA